MKKRILVFGDSNAWGFIPGIGTRYEKDSRWPGVLSGLLPDSIEIIEDCISGRTTVFDDPCDGLRNGKSALGYVLNAHAPLDMVILNLGVNDLKFTNAAGSARGLEELIRLTKNADHFFPLPGVAQHFPETKELLVISPVLLHPRISELFPESELASQYEESKRLSLCYRSICRLNGVHFMDAAESASPSVIDCIHMDAAAHKVLGAAVAAKISEYI